MRFMLTDYPSTEIFMVLGTSGARTLDVGVDGNCRDDPCSGVAREGRHDVLRYAGSTDGEPVYRLR